MWGGFNGWPMTQRSGWSQADCKTLIVSPDWASSAMQAAEAAAKAAVANMQAILPCNPASGDSL